MNELTFTRGLPGLGGAWLRNNGDVILWLRGGREVGMEKSWDFLSFSPFSFRFCGIVRSSVTIRSFSTHQFDHNVIFELCTQDFLILNEGCFSIL